MKLLPYLLFVIYGCLPAPSLGFDEFMYCAKTARTQRMMIEKIPCDLTVHTYCPEPGDTYPWRSIRQYISENRGTMKRMYGEARQLNILKNEFIDTVDYNGFMENTFFYDDDALHRYKKRPTFKPPSLDELTSATPATEGTIPSTTTVTPSTPPTTTATTTTENLPKAEKLIGSENDTIDALIRASEIVNFEQIGSADDIVTYVELTPSDEATILEDEILVTLSTDLEPPTLAFTTNVESPDAAVKAGPDTVATKRPDTTTTETTTVTPSSTIPSTQTTTPSTTTTTTTKSTKKPMKASTIRSKKPHPAPAEGDFRTPVTSKPATTEESSSVGSTAEAATPYIPTYGGNACDTKEEVYAPYWVNSTKGRVYAALNIYPYEQFIHYQKCTNEHLQQFCRHGCRCEQQYTHYKLLVFDVLNECRGIFSDWFRMPSSCVCKCYFQPGDPRSSSRSPRLHEETREERLVRKAKEAYRSVRQYTEEAERAGKFEDPDQENDELDPDLESDVFYSKDDVNQDVFERKPVKIDHEVIDNTRSARKMNSFGGQTRGSLQHLSPQDSKVSEEPVPITDSVVNQTTTHEPPLSSTSEVVLEAATSASSKVHRFGIKSQSADPRNIKPSSSVKKQLHTDYVDGPPKDRLLEERIPRKPILQIAKDNYKPKYKTARAFQANIADGMDQNYPVQWAKPIDRDVQVLKNPR